MDGRSRRRGAASSGSGSGIMTRVLLGLGCLAGVAQGIFYLPGVAPRSYEKGESVRAGVVVGCRVCVGGGVGWVCGGMSDASNRPTTHRSIDHTCTSKPHIGAPVREQADVDQDADPLRLLLAALLPPQEDPGKHAQSSGDSTDHVMWM